MSPQTLIAGSVFLDFLRGPWGLTAFLGGAAVLMVIGFKVMKMMDTKKSYEETYHPPR